MAKGIICSYCQREINQPNHWELMRVTKKLLFLGSKQSFHFHSKAELIAWAQQGKKNQAAPADEET